MSPKSFISYLLLMFACAQLTTVNGRSLKDIAPACSGSKCYTCPEGAAVISGSTCICNGGAPCQEVGTAINEIVANATNTASNAVSNAMEVANNAASNAVSNAMEVANNAVNDANNAVSNAMEEANNAVNDANNAVSNAMEEANNDGGDGSCPQHGDGQAGSRCGKEDLIGYCEDSCGSGDGACCIDNKPVCAC